MLQDDFNRLAKSVDYLSEEQAKRICGVVLERFKNEVGAFIVDIWVRTPGEQGVDVLTRFFHLGEGAQQNPPLAVTLTSEAKGLLVWVAEFDRPILIEDITEGASSALNSLDKQAISGRYMALNPRTRCFAAVPLTYRSQRAVLSIEADFSHSFKDFHIRTMKEIAGPIGNVIWKASVFRENQDQTNDAIQHFAVANAKTLHAKFPYKSGFLARPFSKEFNDVELTLREIFRAEKIRARAFHHPPGGDLVMSELLAQMRSTHFGVVDISELNDNVLIEFGALLSSGSPVLILRRQSSTAKLPFDLAGYQCHEYTMTNGTMLIRNATSLVPVHDFVRTFKNTRLITDSVFRNAKDWNGEEF